jgi:hypothetical protein
MAKSAATPALCSACYAFSPCLLASKRVLHGLKLMEYLVEGGAVGGGLRPAPPQQADVGVEV